jgi:taurine transport system ATP-binding protein
MSVLGPSGCGKTTLAEHRRGFLAPTEGQITLNGHKVTGPDAERGMVFQQGALFEWMSVRDNVSFGPRMKGTPEGEMGGTVDHLLDVVGLQRFQGKGRL